MPAGETIRVRVQHTNRKRHSRKGTVVAIMLSVALHFAGIPLLVEHLRSASVDSQPRTAAVPTYKPLRSVSVIREPSMKAVDTKPKPLKKRHHPAEPKPIEADDKPVPPEKEKPEEEKPPELKEMKGRLEACGALVGASDHGGNLSIYSRDPDGLEFEIMWLVPRSEWGEAETEALIRPLDLAASIERFGADRVGGG